MAKKKPGPDTTCAAYQAMLPIWSKMDALLGGTETMRAAGQLYLPQHDSESDAAYRERLGRATLLNMLQMTVDSWVGKPFSEPVHVGDDVPEQLKALLENIDLQGNNLEVFTRQWFRDGLAKGFSHVLADFPRPKPRADGKPRTLEDDRKDNLRPYLVHVKPENLFFGNATFEGGVETVTEVRILEEITEVVGFEEVTKRQIRRILPGIVQIFREIRDPKTNKVTWVVTEEYNYDLPVIPIITFYADRQAFLQSKPPLADLADLNVAHWQSTSDQTAVLTVARFPILGVSGAINDEELTIGPNQWLHCPDPAGRFYYVEHTGKAIAAGRQHLLDLEEVMAEYGAVFLKKRPGGASATARALDTAECSSPLQDMAIRFQSALQAAMRFLALWMKMDPATVGTFTINTDFDFDQHDGSAAIALGAARAGGDLSRPRFLKELHRLGVLGEDFDATKNDAELKAEQVVKDAQAEKDATLQVKVAAASKPAPAPAAAGGGGGAK